MTDKPPYRVPLMTEIADMPWNGFKVVSTFSGCGGSCLGYRMAGFKVVWANEFVPAAQESYRANMESDCILDCRDIRTVQPEEILEATGLKQGELDLFDGSPPCASFSTAGKREKGWGKAKKYSDVTQRTDDLFWEYTRILRGLQPKVFVAENVSGLVKGTVKGYFIEILGEMKACGYRVKCRILDAQWLGVPQQRQRVIFVGVRENLGLDPVHPKPLPYRYSVKDALPWIEKAIHDTGGNGESRWTKNVDITARPCAAITVGVNSINSCHYKVESLPPSRLKGGAYGVQDVCPEKPCPTVTCGSPGNDLAIECQSDAFPKKYSSASAPAVMAGRTVEMKSNIEKRKFTIAELKRICAFPDDFILTGSYAQQWERLGRSVPPVMMRAIAETIQEGILCKIK